MTPSEQPPRTCQKCGTELPGGSPEELCQACMLEVGLNSEGGTRFGPSTIKVEGPAALNTGELVGRYKIVQPLGEGGCGVVYMAEQLEPVRRRVALKVIKLGMDTRQVIARFEAERQALALMDHPNIAKVHDAGTTADGRPYFVMELVRGVRITDYCDQENLSTSDRLGLFVQVCLAIQHAHQKGIIHRDIKPSNILVTSHDGQALPKVIDFGIAKATTDQRLTDKSYYTAFQQFIGTPAYMSPEQADLTALDIDTRSDIYSLGVLLYELLTGKTPFDARELMEAGLDAMRRAIREKEPPRPSTRLNAMSREELTTTARQRRTEAPKLVHLLAGDLDWIVMKALEKDRTRRYETATNLALDIGRFLREEPVTAAAPSAAYRVRKFVRRNRKTVAAAGLVLVILIGGIIGTTWGLVRAVRQKQEAERQAKIAKHTIEFLTGMFASIDPAAAKLREITVREVLDEAGRTIGSAFPGEPLVEAPIRDTIAVIYRKLGRDDLALPHAETEWRLAKAAYGEKDRPEVAGSLNTIGTCLLALGRADEALKQFELSSAMYRKVYSGDHSEIAEGINNSAICLLDLGKTAEALPKFEEALAMRLRLCKGDHPDVASSLNNLGSALKQAGREPEALLKYEAAAEMWQRFYKGDHPDVARGLNNAGNSLNAIGRPADALPKLKAALEMRQRIYKGDHPDVAASLTTVALCYQDLGQSADALPKFEAASEMWQRLYQGDHPYVAIGLKAVGLCLQSLGRASEALPKLEAALAMTQRIYPGDHQEVAQRLGNVASCLNALGRPADALPKFEAALEMRRRLHKIEHPFVAQALNNVGLCLDALNRSAEALARYHEAIAMFDTLASAQPANLLLKIDPARIYQQIGDLHAKMNDSNQARENYQKGLDLVEAVLAVDPVNVHAKRARQNLRLRLGLDKADVVISSVVPDSPAARMGLQKNDWIVAYGGQKITSGDQLTALRRSSKEPESLLEVRRNGEVLKFRVGEGKLGINYADRNISPAGPQEKN